MTDLGHGKIDYFDPTWDDLQVALGEIKLPGVSDPAWQAYKGGYVLSFSPSADNIISFTAQFPHRYKLESNIDFHIHAAYPDSNAGNSIWNFTYSWAKINEDFPAQTTVSAVSLASPANQDNHTYHDIATGISGTGKDGVSSILICSLQREGTHLSDTYAGAVYLVGLDFHFQSDTLGSAQETTK